jgi:hypothetical protein
MQQAVSVSMATQRFPMVLLGAFAGLALLLASVGIYSLLANFVQHRTQDETGAIPFDGQSGSDFRKSGDYKENRLGF